MSDDTKLYRLLPGKRHNRKRGERSALGVTMQPGETIELNERQAHALRDKFVLADDPAAYPSTDPDDTLPAPGDPDDGAPMEPEPTEPDDEEVDEAIDVEEHQAATAKDLIARMKMSGDPAYVRQVLEAEEAAKGRVSVLNAGDDRLEELTEE